MKLLRRLIWDGKTGRACAGCRIRVFSSPPPMPREMAEMDYAPDHGSMRLREPFAGWRDMHGDEIEAAEQFLAAVEA